MTNVLVYLGEWSEDAIRTACAELKAERLLTFSKTNVRGRNVEAIELTERGKKHYCDNVHGTLHLASGECILDPPPATIKLFFAWQSECKPSRNALFAVVPDAVRQLNERNDLLRPLELIQATQPGEGALRIDVALENKIRQADYFLGDLTPVYAYKGRLRVNENVLVETGFALASKPSSRIILVSMQVSNIDSDGSVNPQPAFDIAHVRRLHFSTKADMQRKLLTELETMLKADGWFAASHEKAQL